MYKTIERRHEGKQLKLLTSTSYKTLRVVLFVKPHQTIVCFLYLAGQHEFEACKRTK